VNFGVVLSIKTFSNYVFHRLCVLLVTFFNIDQNIV